MDVQERIADALKDMSRQLNANHLEVCQRLTALETEVRTTLAPLPERVAKLEGWRNKAAGIMIAGNLFMGGVYAWFKHR